MSVKPSAPRVGRIFAIAILSASAGAFFAILIGIPWLSHNYPESNIAPVLAFVWYAPVVFVVFFATILTIGLARELPWRDESGISLARRLLQGRAPLSVAFLIPLALLICLWLLTVLGTTLVHYLHYPLFMALVTLVNTVISIGWTWLTWRNAGNATSLVKARLAQTITLLYTLNLLAGIAIGFLRS